MHVAVVAHTAIVPCGDIVRTQLASEIRKRSKLDFAVAKHVGIGCSALLVFLNKELENVVHILLSKVARIIRYAKFSADVLHVCPVLFARAATCFVSLFPIGHIQSNHVKTLLFEKSSSDCGVHSAGHTNDHTFCHKTTFICLF